jgi:hypothetical protein
MKQILKTKFRTWALSMGLIALTFVGCSSFKRLDNADGPLDAIMLLAGTAKPDVAPIEKISHGSGAIVSARAVEDRGAISVRGSVRKTGIGWVTTENSHVDVIVLNSQRKIVWEVSTTYFPRVIPNTIRGTEGRSHFSVRLSRPLPPGATIQVIFHDAPANRCEFYPLGLTLLAVFPE